MSFSLAPYYHPTTVVFVDDNENFLRSLDLELPGDWAYRSFSETEEALDFLNRPAPLPPLVDRCFTLSAEDRAHPTVALDFSLIEQEINHLERFSRVSVVMIDYSMPLMNGLEFCAELNDPYLQKAMLTGVADEKVAVQAFNARLIDRFIPKNTSHSISDIVAYAEELQHAYFTQHTARLTNTLSLNPPRFLTDRDVARAVRAMMQREHAVEYYMLQHPPGFLMLRADGSAVKLFVYDEVEIRHGISEARARGAPEDIRTALENRRLVLSYMDAFEDFPTAEYPWAENVLAAERVPGREVWHMALMADPPADIDFDPARCSYEAFLSLIDQRNTQPNS